MAVKWNWAVVTMAEGVTFRETIRSITWQNLHNSVSELISFQCDHGGVLAGGEEHLLEVGEHLRHEGQVDLAVGRSVCLMHLGKFTRGLEKSLFIIDSVMTE